MTATNTIKSLDKTIQIISEDNQQGILEKTSILRALHIQYMTPIRTSLLHCILKKNVNSIHVVVNVPSAK